MEREAQFTTSELVSFGNYLLSKERNENVSEVLKDSVNDADLANWKHLVNEGKTESIAEIS